MKADLKKIAAMIGASQSIGLMTHTNGDGDAFGSLLGLRNILKKLGKKVIVYSNEPLPKYLWYLKKELRYNPKKRYQKADLFIGLDLSSPKRFAVPEIFEKAQKSAQTIVIDHHTDGDLHKSVDAVWQKTDISSTAEMIYWLNEELRVRLDKVTAELLLWGVETDTFFLLNPNTFSSTHEA